MPTISKGFIYLTVHFWVRQLFGWMFLVRNYFFLVCVGNNEEVRNDLN